MTDDAKKYVRFTRAPGDEGDELMRFIASDDTPDRDGDVIDPMGWELDEYRSNPVFLWAHDYCHPPVGVAREVDVQDGRLMIGVEFDDEDDFSAMVKRKYQKGHLNAVSVGFRPLDWEELEDGRGYRYTRQALLEVSAVPVPSNPAALAQRSAGDTARDVRKAWAREARDWLVKQGFEVKDPEVNVVREAMKDFEGMSKGGIVETVLHMQTYKSLTLQDAIALANATRALKATASARLKAGPDELEVGDFVRWDSSGGVAQGAIERIERDGMIDVPDADVVVEGTADDPAALIRIYNEDDGGWEPTDVMVGHRFSTLTKIDPLPAPPEEDGAGEGEDMYGGEEDGDDGERRSAEVEGEPSHDAAMVPIIYIRR